MAALMLNWLNRLKTRGAVRASCRAALRACDSPPSDRLRSAISETASALGSGLSRGELRRHRGRIIVILARQLADANERLGSSYWTGPDGHNVGRDVLQAYGIAVSVLRGTAGAGADDRPDTLRAVVERLAQQAALYRSKAPDRDGYGSATLGEMERDLRQLLSETRAGMA